MSDGDAFLVAVQWPDADDDACPRCSDGRLKPAIPIDNPDNTIAVVCLSCDFHAVRDKCANCGESFTREEDCEHVNGRFFHVRCIQ